MVKSISLALSCAVLLAACGGGGGSSGSMSTPTSVGTTGPTAPGNGTVQVNLGDGPADRLMAVNVTINSVTLTRSDGASVTVTATTQSLEMMSLMASVRPIAIADVPAGSYTAITLLFGDATVTWVDPAGGQLVQKTLPGPRSRTVTFATPLTVSAGGPVVINLDLDMARSVTFDAAGSLDWMPMLSAGTRPMQAGSHDPEDGGMFGMTAMVSGVNGSGFRFEAVQGVSGMSIGTGNGTRFMGMNGSGMNGMGGMSQGMLVSFDATRQSDGSWMASRVQASMPGGTMAAGVVTSLTGTPPTQLTLVMGDGAGASMMRGNLAGTSTVNLDPNTTYTIDGTGVDLTALPFTPVFTRDSLAVGQRLRALSGGNSTQGGGMHGMMGGSTVSATQLVLAEQGLGGTVTGYSASGERASFTLTLAEDSAFKRLTGAASITVYRQPGTALRGTAPANGGSVQVRGLLFRDGAAYRLVAHRIRGL